MSRALSALDESILIISADETAGFRLSDRRGGDLTGLHPTAATGLECVGVGPPGGGRGRAGPQPLDANGAGGAQVHPLVQRTRRLHHRPPGANEPSGFVGIVGTALEALFF